MEEHRGWWSAAGGVVTAVGAGLAGLVWQSYAQEGSDTPLWPVYVFGAIAIIGFYGMVSPLAHLWPWKRPKQSPDPALREHPLVQRPADPGSPVDTAYRQVMGLAKTRPVTDYVATLGGSLRPRDEVESEMAEREAETHTQVLAAVDTAIRDGEAILNESAGPDLKRRAMAWNSLAVAFVEPPAFGEAQGPATVAEEPWDVTRARMERILVALREIQDRG